MGPELSRPELINVLLILEREQAEKLADSGHVLLCGGIEEEVDPHEGVEGDEDSVAVAAALACAVKKATGPEGLDDVTVLGLAWNGGCVHVCGYVQACAPVQWGCHSFNGSSGNGSSTVASIWLVAAIALSSWGRGAPIACRIQAPVTSLAAAAAAKQSKAKQESASKTPSLSWMRMHVYRAC